MEENEMIFYYSIFYGGNPTFIGPKDMERTVDRIQPSEQSLTEKKCWFLIEIAYFFS